MASTVDQITGLIPITVAGGVTLAFTERAFGGQQQRRRKPKKRVRRVRKSVCGHPGDFRNVGL